MPVYLPIKEVMAITHLSRSSIHKLAKLGAFPSPRKLGPHQKSRVIWDQAELYAWIENQKQSPVAVRNA